MDFSYQMIAIQGTLVGTALIILWMFMGAPIIKLKEKKLREELKQLRKLSKTDKEAKKDAVEDETEEELVKISPPVLVPVSASPAVKAETPDAPIYFEGIWYPSIEIAAKRLDRAVDTIRQGCSTKQDGKTLWDPNGHFEVAVRHRTLPIEGAPQKLVISDYNVAEGSSKMISRGFVIQGRDRIKIDAEDQETGPETVQFFQVAAKSALLGL